MLAQAHVEETIVVPSLPKKSVEKLFFLASLGVIGFLVLLAGLQFAKTDFLVENIAPENMAITNITDVSFTVSWGTEEPVSGYLVFGKDPQDLSSKAFDNLAQGDMASFTSKKHQVTLTSLEPNTYYYFKIVSDGKTQDITDGEFIKPIKTASNPILTNPVLGKHSR